MLDIILIALRAVQALFAIIVLGLTGNVAALGDNVIVPSEDSFMIFAAVWTLVILIYLSLAPRFFSAFAHPVAMLGLDALTMLFWFAGFIALGVWHHRASEVYVDVDDGFYDYSKACALAGSYCHEVEAAVVFGAFEWALFVATTVLLALEFMRGRGGRSKTTAGPATAQV